MNTDGIVYVPQYCTYRIKVGKTIVEVDAWALKQAWNVDQIESILRSGTDTEKRNLLDSIVRIGGRLGLTNGLGDDGYTSSYDPIDALYRGAMDPRDNVVACVDIPKPMPDYDPSTAPKVYFNERFPSKRSVDIIDEAIELLSSKKNVHMTKVSANLSVNQVFEGFKLRLHSDMPAARGMGKTMIVLIKHTAFDRAHKTDIDDNARLMAKLDTNTYIKLRIAFLLYEALKTCEYNKQSMDSDVFEIIYSD